MYKQVADKPDYLKFSSIEKLYSVSNCISKDFTDWINYWKHNGYWLFDNLTILQEIAGEAKVALDNMTPFFYKASDKQWEEDKRSWQPFSPEKSFTTNVVLPTKSIRKGYDIVTYECQTTAEHSPLSCNHFADKIDVNQYCLLDSFEEAKRIVEAGELLQGAQGPYRIIEVHEVSA